MGVLPTFAWGSFQAKLRSFCKKQKGRKPNTAISSLMLYLIGEIYRSSRTCRGTSTLRLYRLASLQTHTSARLTMLPLDSVRKTKFGYPWRCALSPDPSPKRENDESDD